MAVVITVVGEFPLPPGDPRYDTRETRMIVATFTKLNSDATIAWATGLAEVYYGNAIGNIIAKPFRRSALSAGTITFDDGGSTANTAGMLIAVGRK